MTPSLHKVYNGAAAVWCEEQQAYARSVFVYKCICASGLTHISLAGTFWGKITGFQTLLAPGTNSHNPQLATGRQLSVRNLTVRKSADGEHKQNVGSRPDIFFQQHCFPKPKLLSPCIEGQWRGCRLVSGLFGPFRLITRHLELYESSHVKR